MPSAPLVILAILLICAVMSTREGIAAARLKLKPYNRPLWIFAVVAWSLLLFGCAQPP